MHVVFFVFLVLIVGAIFSIYMYKNAHNDHLTFESIYLQRLPEAFEEYRIFFIADIHRRQIKEETLNEITEPIEAVFLGGDMIERGVPLQRLRDNIRKLKRWNCPIYFVWGNNDYEVTFTEMIKILHEEQVIILADSLVSLVKDNEQMNLIGFDYDKEDEGRTINRNILDDTVTILLTHTPQSFYFLTNENKAIFDLVLAGHTHGGQIRLFNIGPYKNGGFKKWRNTLIFVTEGYGYSLLPFRLGTSAQCHVLTLKKD